MENTGVDKLPLCPSHSTIYLKQLFTNLYDLTATLITIYPTEGGVTELSHKQRDDKAVAE